MRARSLLLSACGIAAALALWGVLTAALPAAPVGAGAVDRFAVALAALLPALVVLAAMVFAQIATRFATGRFDPTSGQDGRFLVVNQRAISNTVEQLAIFLPALLALAGRASAGMMPALVAAALTFAVARAVFWAGYLAHPLLRAPGMAATGTTSLGALAAACWTWFAA